MSNVKPDRLLFREAAQLLTRLNSGHATEADHAEFARWQSQSDAHRHIGALAQQLRRHFEAVPAGLSRTLRHETKISGSRRRAVKTLSLLAVAGPTAWLVSRMPWDAWNAGYRTATGAQRDVQLADGTHVIMNTASAMDVAADTFNQRLMLREGEIMVVQALGKPATPGSAPALSVQTAEGSVEAVGAKFSVRQLQGFTKVAAFTGDVTMSPLSGPRSRLLQGQRSSFTREAASVPQSVNERDALWARGLIFADNMRLADLLAELSRYHSGLLRWTDEVADLRVSGLYQLSNPDAALALLERSYPVHVQSITPYWTVVEARGDAGESPKTAVPKSQNT
jgi:transmembrane sensor